MLSLRLRAPELILVGFFAYLCILVPFFPARPHLRGWSMPLTLVAVVFSCVVLARLEQTRWRPAVNRFRDFFPIALTFGAFQSMERFLPRFYDQASEQRWIHWDRVVLQHWHLQSLIESMGALLPAFLELCYLLVYGLPFYCLALIYLAAKRRTVDGFLSVYLVGTLAAYGCFPFFPTEPPRLAFPDVAVPVFTTFFRQANLALLHAGTIHVGVFPSAHVSSAFAAAWGLFLAVPQKKQYGFGALVYAVCVSVAVVYGRYHYVVDVGAGFAIGLLAGVVALALYQFSRSRRLRM